MLEGIQKTYLLESNGFTVEVSLSEKYDILENASSVSVGLRVKSAYKRGIQYLSGSIKIDGKTLLVMDSTVSTHNVQINAYDTWYKVMRSLDSYTDSPWTMENITHDTEGAKRITLELEMRGYGADDYLSLRVATTKTITLTKIPRASTVAATDANIGAVSTVSVIRSVPSYTHSIACGFGTFSGYLTADGSVSASEVKLTETNIPFRLPESFHAQIPNAPAGECVLTIRTYSGSEQIGNGQTAKFTATAGKKLCKPAVSGAVVDTNTNTVALTGDNNILVRYMSNAKCTITATAKNGASIEEKTIGGVKVTGSSLIMEGTQADTVRFACRDSRGYTASADVKKTMIPYVPLSAAIHAARTDPTGGNVKLEVSGICYRGSFGAAENTLSVVCRANNGGAITVTPQFDGNAFTAETILSGLDYQQSHTVSVTVTDKLQTVTKSVKVGKGIPVFDWDEDDFQFHVPVQLSDGCDVLKNGKVAYIPQEANKVFVKLTDIGIKTFPTTMKTVADTMPKNSMLMLDSRDILSGGVNEISNLGVTGAGMYLFFRGNSNARLSLLHIYGGVTATTGFMNYGCYASTDDNVVWVRGERQNGSYPDCRYRTSADGTSEYINPPMLPGTEYRTTERWNGRPVYRKLLVCTTAVDMVGNTTTTFAHGISGLDVSSARLEITTYFSKYDDNNGATSAWIMPYTSLNTNENLFVSKISDTQITLRSEGGANWDEGRTFYFTMKYCKK